MAKMYNAICHTDCYWLETLWKIGNIYEGVIKPNKHFSDDGKIDNPLPPPNPGADKRSNVQLREELQSNFNFKARSKATRKELWSKLQELETASARDALTSDEIKFTAKCGFEAKSHAGVLAHERSCNECKGEQE